MTKFTGTPGQGNLVGNTLGEQAALLVSSQDRITALRRITKATQISIARSVVMSALGHLTAK
jgi:hypothetical protein